MATPFITKHGLTILALTYIFTVPCILLGKADDYFPQTGATNGYIPQTGAANGYVPQTGAANGYVPQTGGADGYVPQIGSVGEDDPAEVVSKALLCFNNNYVYSSCEQSYRLTESGNINVPPEYADQYCHGSCFSETNLVLNCIDNILSHFLFYNRASIQDVRETVKAGCSYGPERGNFNVAEHIQARENSAPKGSKSVMLGLLLMIVYMGYYLVH
ncbi:Glycine-rich family protein [Heracleum sosnowskyi]|uniref:Glycine-rich family protein n=1 Tax=Heracleum sosnowskyi TaxID=360622 RepID=A0AAD8MUV2_9APIA|nr:Glycine-rich family protein [Heracleum sosnowskyi]